MVVDFSAPLEERVVPQGLVVDHPSPFSTEGRYELGQVTRGLGGRGADPPPGAVPLE